MVGSRLNSNHCLWEDVTCVCFPGISAGKESACNAGDPGSIPRLGSSPGQGIGYPPQYYRASMVAQMVKNLPTMPETWVWSLDWEDPLEEGVVTQYSCLENPHGQRSLAWLQSMGSQRVRHHWATKHKHIMCRFFCRCFVYVSILTLTLKWIFQI